MLKNLTHYFKIVEPKANDVSPSSDVPHSSKKRTRSRKKPPESPEAETSLLNDSIDEFEPLQPVTRKKNAFQVMMESRHKSIGQNSCGKENKDEVEDPGMVNAKKDSLKARKKLLKEWADEKGGLKRKRDEEDIDRVNRIKLSRRKRRMMKLLNCEAENGISLVSTPESVGEKRKQWKMRIRVIDINSEEEEEVIDNIKKEAIIDLTKEKPTKLAPVFIRSPKCKPTVSSEAKLSFLHSELPENLRREFANKRLDIVEREVFSKIPHVQQKSTDRVWTLPKVNLPLRDEDFVICNKVPCLKYGDLTLSLLKTTKNSNVENCQHLLTVLQQLKDDNSKFPVYEWFKSLYENSQHCRNNVEMDKVMWTEKYKPTSFYDITENVKTVKALKEWLEQWQSNSLRNKDSDSDFEGSDNSDRGAALLVGPSGSGKTSSVYALCAELGINILELNASSKRTGKRLLQELQEATQSHRVKNSAVNFSLLLIEDVDIVFDQDENFISSLSQLLCTSKRPIVLTATDGNSINVQRFSEICRPFKFFRKASKSTRTFLQLICANEGYFLSNTELKRVLDDNRKDLRRTLLDLQLWLENSEGFMCSSKNLTFPKEICKESPWYQKNQKKLGKLLLRSASIGGTVDFSRSWSSLYSVTESDEENFERIKNLALKLDYLSVADVICDKIEVGEARKTCRFKDSLESGENMMGYSEMEDLSLEIANAVVSAVLDNADPSETRCKHFQLVSYRSFQSVVPHLVRINNSALLDYHTTFRALCRLDHEHSLNSTKRRFFGYLTNLGLNIDEKALETARDAFKS